MSARLGWLAAALIALLLCGLGLGELAGSSLTAPDLDLVRDLAAHRSPPLTTAAHAASWAGSSVAIVPLAVASCMFLWRGRRRASALAVVLSVLMAFAISMLDKLVVGRGRPPLHHLEPVSSASFPSGHATQASAFYGALLIAFLAGRPRRALAVAATIAAVALIGAVALSRVYLAVHYPSDVVGGVLLGGACALLAHAGLSRASRGAPGAAIGP